MRIKLIGQTQRKFLDLVVEKLSCGSLRSILQYGLDTSYASLKNYYSGRRLLSKDLFNDLCRLAKIDLGEVKYSEINDNWGKVKGGKNGKRKA